MLQLIKKQDSMSKSIDEVKLELKETTTNVNILLEEKKKNVDQAPVKNKRKYPSLLTVSSLTKFSKT